MEARQATTEHWTQKAREDMTERDWRIFREDFNISYKGVQVSGAALPVRNWEEAKLPAMLMKAIDELVSLSRKLPMETYIRGCHRLHLQARGTGCMAGWVPASLARVPTRELQ